MFDRLKKKLHRHKDEKKAGDGPSVPASSSATTAPEKPSAVAPSTKEVAPTPPEETIPPSSEPLAKDAPAEVPQQKEPRERDLWLDAFNQLPQFKQDNLRRMGFDTIKTGQMESTINDLVGVVNKKQEECEKKFWRISIGGEEIVLRNYTTQILGWLEKAGDIAVQFAPPQASLPWGLIKNMMQIPVNESEQMGAMLATTERIVRITSRGQVYEQVYLPRTYDEPLNGVQKGLESSLLQIYAQSLDLLAESLDLFSSGTARRTLEAIMSPGKYTGSLSGLGDQEDEMLRDVQACESKRSAAADGQMIEMLDALNAPMARMDTGISNILQHMEESDLIKMLEWISPLPFGKHHDDIKERRTPGTGEWLLQHKDFRSWEEKKSSGLFWLQGSPGTGKTYLTSSVVDRIQGGLCDQAKDEGFAYFYCRRTEEERSKPLPILQSIVRQLSTAASRPESIRIQLSEACKIARNRGSNFRADECKKQILASLDSYEQTTLIIDAMDECDPRYRDELINVLNSLIADAQNPVKIFISSRPDPEIEALFKETPNIGISASDNQDDIQKFLTVELDRLSHTARFVKRLKASIIEKFLQRCQGMFQWASLQMVQIEKCKTESSVWNRLNNLPEDLQKAYDEIWAEIESFEEPDQSIVKRALYWVMAATKPMTSEMILSAIRVGSDGSVLPLGDKLTEEDLISLCSNFLTVDSQLKVWRFSHLSVREYLDKKPGWSISDAHKNAASTCLSYMMKAYETESFNLNFDPESVNSSDSEATGESDDGFERHHPFHLYMRHAWYQHIRLLKEPEKAMLKPLLQSFLGAAHNSSMQYRNWHQMASKDSERWTTLWDNPYHAERYFGMDCPKDIADQLSPSSSAVFAVCRFSFEDVFADWYEGGEINIPCQNDRGFNLLFLSALAGSLPICKLLVEGGIDLKFILDLSDVLDFDDNKHKSALAAAALHGNLEIVKYLVEAGADANVVLPPPAYITSNSALESAIESESLETMKYLVQEAKTDISLTKHTDKEEPEIYGIDQTLLAVSKTYNVEMLKFVLETSGADVNMHIRNTTHPEFPSMLTIKLSYCDLEGIEFLLKEAGADVNRPLDGEDYGSAFEYSLVGGFNDQFNFAKHFVENYGANVNAKSTTGYYGSPLATACVFEYDPGLVKYLLEKGADVNMPLVAGNYGSALAVACSHREGIVDFLVKEAGANVNASFTVGCYGSALAAASAHSARTTEFLLKEGGADVNMTLDHPDFGCALTRAALSNDLEAMDVLIAGGADIHVQHPSKTYGTPLIVASLFGAKRSVERLIKAGVDVNAKLENSSRFSTALEAAQADWSEKDESLLLQLLHRHKRSIGVEYLIVEKLLDQKSEVAQFLRENGATA